jgi:hypothetical protein
VGTAEAVGGLEPAGGWAPPGAPDVRSRTPGQLFWERFREDRVALAALGFICFEIIVAGGRAADRRGRRASSERAVPGGARSGLRDADRPLSTVLLQRGLPRPTPSRPACERAGEQAEELGLVRRPGLWGRPIVRTADRPNAPCPRP